MTFTKVAHCLASLTTNNIVDYFLNYVSMKLNKAKILNKVIGIKSQSTVVGKLVTTAVSVHHWVSRLSSSLIIFRD